MRTHATRRTPPWLAGTLALLALFWLVDLGLLRAGVPDPLDDSWEYGAVARSLLAGHGFRTPVIHPPLWTLRDSAGTVPLLVHGPLVPLLLAPPLAMLGPGLLDHVALFAALFAVLAALSIYRLGERWYSPPVGAAAAGLFTLSPLTLRAVHHDVALTLGAWLLAFAIDQLSRARPRGLRAGLAIGAGLLVRPEFLFAVPVLALLARPAAMRFLPAALAPLVPWMWHDYVNAGSPLFNLSSYLLIGYWGARPEIGVLRDFALPPRAWLQALAHALPTLPAKWLAFLPHALKRTLFAPSAFTGWLAPLGLFAPLPSPGARALASASCALALLPLAIMTVTLFDARYLVPFLPVFALAAARGASGLADRLPAPARHPSVWLATLAVLVLVSEGPALVQGRREAVDARLRLRTERSALGALTLPEPPGLVYSDTPDFVAWTLRRPALWVTQAEYRALPEASGPAPAPADRPTRASADACWFHAADGRGGALSPP